MQTTEKIDIAPLCVRVLEFRDAFVGYCGRKDNEYGEKLESVLSALEDEARALRTQLQQAH